VAGLGESSVEQRLDRLLHNTNPTIATYAKADAVDVRISAKAATLGEAETLVSEMEWQAREVLGQHVFGIDQDTPESVVLQMLIERVLSLATMESCSGGLLASTITDVPGSSAAFKGGLVAYATEMKVAWGVPGDIIAQYGVISVETARAMAAAARAFLGADIGIGVTGVAGPDLQEEKSVGTVHIAVAGPDRVSDTSQHFRGARTEIKWRATITAINLLRLHLLRAG
jgi:nicotinamide-nucleotide amidase